MRKINGAIPDSKSNYQKYIRGKYHDYRCYGTPWHDTDGNTHKPGWYDEDNNRYDGIAKEGDSQALCTCSYCDKTSIFMIEDDAQTQFECPNCGGPVNFISIVKYTDPITNETTGKEKTLSHEESEEYSIKEDKELKRIVYGICFSLILIVLSTYSLSDDGNKKSHAREKHNNNYESQTQKQNNYDVDHTQKQAEWDVYSERHYRKIVLDDPEEGNALDGYFILHRQDEDSITYNVLRSNEKDKAEVFKDGIKYKDSEMEYYIKLDPETGDFLYWYKPISGIYFECGWIKYVDEEQNPRKQEENWYIQNDDGEWERACDKFDTSKLYCIEW